jgi:UDP-N-acetylmuramoylalanine--D-glutamate ligase
MQENSKLKNYHSKLDLTLLSRERVRTSEDDHHMEFVDEINGIAYVNDSKSIRVSATRNSLEAIETSVILIIGGNDQEVDYSTLAKQIKEKVVAIIYLGNTPNAILQHFSKHYMLFVKATDINEAVLFGSIYGKSGDVVLFSPACSGQIESDNYKKRGNEFKAAVKKLAS